jgi:hypothetical protein
MNADCTICGENVPLYDQADHLRFKHPGPFKFWYEGRPFTTDTPSMTVAELLKLVNGVSTYYFYMEVPGREDVPLSHHNAVDLTQEPHFYSIPPATY